MKIRLRWQATLGNNQPDTLKNEIVCETNVRNLDSLIVQHEDGEISFESRSLANACWKIGQIGESLSKRGIFYAIWIDDKTLLEYAISQESRAVVAEDWK